MVFSSQNCRSGQKSSPLRLSARHSRSIIPVRGETVKGEKGEIFRNKEKIDIVFFNSGYLPDSQSPLITKSSSSLKALSDAYDLLNEGGYLSIALYKGHEGGLKETIAIKNRIKDLNIIETYKEHKSLLEPELFIIKK